MRRTIIILLLLLAGLLAACDPAGEADPTPTTPPPTLAPTATRTPAPTYTAMPLIPAVTAGPFATPTDACPLAPQTRLLLGERGQVSDDDDTPLNVRSGPGTDFRILGRLEVLDVFYVIDGPTCGGPYAWYLVEHDDLRGWIAEGDSAQYYVQPYLPG